MRTQKGQSLVEFALILPLLLLILFGIMDFGRLFHVYLTIDHAGREAARSASIGQNDTVVKKTAVDDAVDIGLTVDKVVINPSGSRSSGNDVTITITYPITFLTPIVGSIVGPITIKDTTIMRVE